MFWQKQMTSSFLLVCVTLCFSSVFGSDRGDPSPLVLNTGSEEKYQNERWSYYKIAIPDQLPGSGLKAHLTVELGVNFLPVRAPIQGYGTATPILSLSTSSLFPEEDLKSSSQYIYANYVDYDSFYASQKKSRIEMEVETHHRGSHFIVGVANFNSEVSPQFYYYLQATLTETKSCPNDCTSSDAGICGDDGQCVCYKPWLGDDCSIKAIEFKPEVVHNFYLLPYHTEYALLSVSSAEINQEISIIADAGVAFNDDGLMIGNPVVGHILKDVNQNYDAIPSEKMNNQKFVVSPQAGTEYHSQLFQGKTWIVALRYEPENLELTETVMRVAVRVTGPEDETPTIPLLYIIFIAFFVVFLLGLVTISGIKACNRDVMPEDPDNLEMQPVGDEESFYAAADLAKTLFPEVTFESVKDNVLDSCCSICLDEYSDDSKIRMLGCHHSFHQVCIDNWFERNSKCPLCKRSIDILSTMVQKDGAVTFDLARARTADAATHIPNAIEADIESGQASSQFYQQRV